MERVTGNTLQIFRNDGGGEFKGVFSSYLQDTGILQRTTEPHTSESNGVVERWQRTLLDRLRAIFADTRLPRRLWPVLVGTVTYLHNVLPNSNNDKTPYELVYGVRPNVANLKRIGCVAYVQIPSQNRDKMGNRAKLAYMIGYAIVQGTKGYLLWDPVRDQIIASRNVTFDETRSVAPEHQENPEDLDLLEEDPLEPVTDTTSVSDETEYAVDAILDEKHNRKGKSQLLVKWTGYETPTWEPRSNLTDTLALKLWDRRLVSTANAARTHEPDPTRGISWKEAMSMPDKDEYLKAAHVEFQALLANKTWTLVPRPPHGKVVGSRWVFRKVMNPDGTLKKYKARAVCQGFTQRFGIDFDETYAPTLPLAALRLFLAFAITYKMDIHSMDAVTAFLNSDMDKEVYVEQFHAFHDKQHPDYVLLLKKALYGLKQAPLLWYRTLRAALLELGYRVLEACPCIFFKYVAPGIDGLVLLLIFVDDFLTMARLASVLAAIKAELHSKFKFTDQGRIRNHLGLTYMIDLDAGVLVM
jgi:hypothetical protein